MTARQQDRHSELAAERLTIDAARTLTDEVKADAAALWTKLLRLYEGEAHIALGYSSWGEYYAEEFGQSANYGYRILKAAEVVAQLPMGNSDAPTERVTRELIPVLREGPEQVEEVWGEVVEEHGPNPTAAQVREVVANHRTEEPESPMRKPCERCGRPKEPGRARRRCLACANEPPPLLTERQVAQANATRDRLSTALHTLSGMCGGLDEMDVQRATRTATPEVIEAWIEMATAAVSRLQSLKRKLGSLS